MLLVIGAASRVVIQMLPSKSGSIPLFRFAGIQVFVHWSWLLLVMYEVTVRRGLYSSPLWIVAEVIATFTIVTMHEFGHSLACRQVGGKTHDIVLWPFGGVAYVAPPPRASATLWSIAAGPLVNVALVPVLIVVGYVGFRAGVPDSMPDAWLFILSINYINLLLLAFNMAPVYPLDGGQILQCLLWFKLGRARSLRIASIVGLVSILPGVLLLWHFGYLNSTRSLVWYTFLAFFFVQQCQMGLREAKFIKAIERMPRHLNFACPSCHASPPGGPIWACPQCRRGFDPFSTHAVCPHCGTAQPTTVCINCGKSHPIAEWRGPATVAEPPVIPLDPSA